MKQQSSPLSAFQNKILHGYFCLNVLIYSTKNCQELSNQWLRWQMIEQIVIIGKPTRIKKVRDCFKVNILLNCGESINLIIDKKEFLPNFVAPFNKLMKQQSNVIFLNIMPIVFMDQICFAFRPEKSTILSISKQINQKLIKPIEELFQQESALQIEYNQLFYGNYKKIHYQGMNINQIRANLQSKSIKLGLVGIPQPGNRLLLKPFSSKTSQFYRSGLDTVLVTYKRGAQNYLKFANHQNRIFLPRCILTLDQQLQIKFQANCVYTVPNVYQDNYLKVFPKISLPKLHSLSRSVNCYRVTKLDLICSICKGQMISSNICKQGHQNTQKLRIFACLICQCQDKILQIVLKGKCALDWFDKIILQLIQNYMEDQNCIDKKIILQCKQMVLIYLTHNKEPSYVNICVINFKLNLYQVGFFVI